MAKTSQDETQVAPGMSPLQRAVIVLLILVLVGSLVWRVVAAASPRSKDSPEAGATQSNGASATQSTEASGFVGLDAARKSTGDSPEGIERHLPVITEGSLFGLIGFALGYLSRKLVKLALILIAVVFLAIQGMVALDVITVDWGGMVEKVQHTFFDLRENQTFTEFLTRHVPSAAALIVGYLVGFRRG